MNTRQDKRGSVASIVAPIDNSPVLQVEGLGVAYKTRGGFVEPVRNVSFEIARGETLGLVGESGCGKSTTGWAIVNFLGPNGSISRGSIKFLGQELVGRSETELQQIRGNQIAMVYQDPFQSLNPTMRIGEQMREVLVVHGGLSEDEATQQCIDMLNRVAMPDPEDVLARYPHQLSGGQLQRVVIATALLNNPTLLILDEPTTALDVTVEAAVLELINDLRRDFNMAVMFISHNLGVIAQTCDRVAVMYAGELVEQASVAQLFARPQHPYTQSLIRCIPPLNVQGGRSTLQPIPGRVPSPGERPGGCWFAPRCAYAQDRCRTEHPAWRQVADGGWVRCHFAEEIQLAGVPVAELIEPARVAQVGSPTRPIILQTHDLQKYYPVRDDSWRGVVGRGDQRFVHALECATLAVPQGTTLGIVGESGSGKSTLVRTVIGLEASSKGQVEFLGFDISGDLATRDVELIRRLQMVFQNPEATMNPAYTVGQQLARPLVRFKTVPRSEVHAEVVRLLEAVRLGADTTDRYSRQLSGGEKQRVGIARALASRPDMILCDEPVSSLDVSVQAALLNLLLDVQRRLGTTMIFIGHDLNVVRYLADHIAVMYLGEIVEFGPTAEVNAPPLHPYTEALLSAVPVPDPTMQHERIRLDGTVPSAIDPPRGCRFHTRCPRRYLLPDGGRICEVEQPPWRTADGDHQIACHIPLDILKQVGDAAKQGTV